MTFSQFLTIMRARWLTVTSVMFGVVFLALAISLMLPKTYTGSVDMLINASAQDPVTGMLSPMTSLAPSYAATQVDIITSTAVASRVVHSMNLDKDDNLLALFQAKTHGHGSFTLWMADLLDKNLDVKPPREGNVIQLNFDAKTPKDAKDYANAFAQAYIQTEIDLRAEPARQTANWFDQQLKDLRANIDRIQHKMSDYQREHGIVEGDERLDVETAKLTQLSEALVQAQSTSMNSESREHQLTSNPNDNTLSDVLTSPSVQTIKAQLADSEAKLATMSATVGKNHPLYIQQKAETDALRERLDHEINSASVSVRDNAKLSQRMANELSAELAAQKLKVISMKHARDELTSMQQELESAQHNYDAAIQRAAQSHLQGQFGQTDVAILAPAEEPTEPSKPRIALNVILAIFNGAFLGMLAAIVREMRDRRIRSTEDLAEVLGLPVLAVLATAPIPRRARRAVATV